MPGRLANSPGPFADNRPLNKTAEGPKSIVGCTTGERRRPPWPNARPVRTFGRCADRCPVPINGYVTRKRGASPRVALVGLAVALALASGLPAATAAAGDVIEHSIPTAASLPQGIVAGADGGLWFTERTANAIGRVGLDGTFTEFPLPNAGSQPYFIAAGPDGNVWFTERSGNRIGRMSPTGAVTEFAVPTSASRPAGIADGPDGGLWFTESFGNRVARITIDGIITEFPLAHAFSGPGGIAPGPDGAMWFTESGFGGNRIGRITTDGAITEFPLTLANRLPSMIVTGPDGNLWFTEGGGNAIGRMTPTGVLDEFVVPASLPNVSGIAAGPDGNLWFTELGANNIGRITTDGTITEFPVPTVDSQPFGIAPGPDGATWFSEQSANKIGRIEGTSPPPSDTTAPTIGIAAPVEGAIYAPGQEVLADYACSDEDGGSGLAGCDGPVASGTPIDTSLGAHKFTVSATDNSGNASTASVAYAVHDTTAPTIEIVSPAKDAIYALGQRVVADYTCADEPGGSGLGTCLGPVASGEPIDTGIGTHVFTVTATDLSSNQGTASNAYIVLGRVRGPLLPAPVLNLEEAGRTLPIGLDLGPSSSTAKADHPRGSSRKDVSVSPFADGFPASRPVDCSEPSQQLGDVQPADVHAVDVTASGKLQFEWQTDRTWSGTCRALVIRFTTRGWSDAPLTFFVRFT